ncbi:MAG: signal peptidase I [Deltaproteobacteria bacterium RBG_16_49_23]|nr:MAG: signal peptidase I [Deltaproteobacteria bacterium RBG_16_49_23]
MVVNKKIRRFFFPSLTPAFLIRAGCIALIAYLVFGHLLTPFRIKGHSMEPAYRDGEFNFCWRFQYFFSKPKKGDVVVIRFAGQRVSLLKRVVALEGEEVEFRNGRLFTNSKEMNEPYIHTPYDWNLSPRQVESDSIYVVGDNRSGPIQNHFFGQTSLKRVLGSPLW